MNKEHIKELIKQIEFGHERGIRDAHSEKELARLKALLPETPVKVDIQELKWEAKVDKCKTKAQLEKLVLEEKNIDIDKRKKLSDLKVEALKL